MTEKLEQHTDKSTDAAENCGVEIALDDLNPTADVNGGYVPTATDVTLKRGIIGGSRSSFSQDSHGHGTHVAGTVGGSQ